MKTALTSTLMALTWIGLAGGKPVVAQHTPQSHAQTDTVTGQVDVAARENSVTGDVSQSSGMVAADPPSPLMPNGGLLIDNGLWDGMPVGPCCAICGGGSGCPPNWYIEQGVRVLTRSKPRGTDISSDFDGGTLQPVLNNRTAGPDISMAYATAFGHYFARDKLNRDHFVEFSYWGLNGWRDEATVSGTRTSSEDGAETMEYGTLYSQYALVGTSLDGFDRADFQTTRYSSYNHNFELNGRISPRGRNDRLVLHPNGKWRRECQPGTYMSYLYGVRFMQIDETFQFHSEGTTLTYDTASGQLIDTKTYTGDYDVSTHNNLLGIQIGADMTFRKCRWSWGIRSKLTPCLNLSDQVSQIHADMATQPDFSRRLAETKHEAALLGEVGFTATYKFRPNLMGRASYDIIWVTGLALAPEQLQFNTNPVNQINTNGMICYQGLSLSLEWLW